MRGVRRFTDVLAWQACDAYKKAVYKLLDKGVFGKDWKRLEQLEDSVAGPPGHVAEGFGRFNPPDFARFTVIARSSIMESQSHLIDAVDKRYITEQTRLELDSLAVSALEEVTGLMEYLQSPEALRNARRARERRIASRPERLSRRTQNREPSNPEQTNPEQANPEQANPEHPNKEPRTELEHEPRSENPEE